MPSSMAMASSYWCYRCNRVVRVWPQGAIVCPDCDGGFLEEIDAFPLRRRRFPSESGDGGSAVADGLRPPSELSSRASSGDGGSAVTDGLRPPSELSSRAPSGDRSSFNPVIVLRGSSESSRDADRVATTSFDLYYDEENGSGLRPLPDSISDFIVSSGFDRLLDLLARAEINGVSRGRGSEHPPASKAAVESMPTVEITNDHTGKDCRCAICMDAFEPGAEAREMPCKHIYHQDCILPWLSVRNSCPVCRHEMPAEAAGNATSETEGDEHATVTAAAAGNEEDTVGLTIWRLPGGGYAVGTFSGRRRPGERGLPAVYSEVDVGSNNNGAQRRVSRASRGSRARERGGVGRAIRSFLSFFRRPRPRMGSSSPRLSSESPHASARRHERSSVIDLTI